MSAFDYWTSKAKNSIISRYKTFRVKQRARLKRYRTRFVDLGNPQAVIWIFGCQRSGTTFLENIFHSDLDSAVFGEFSELTIDPRKTVLSDSETVRQIVLAQNAKYAVIRPLFESDRAVELMDLFPNSVGVWLFRDGPHVVDSMIRKWGDRFFEISKRVENNRNGTWRFEETVGMICNDTQKTASHNLVAEMYAQYWLIRNQIPVALGLFQDPRMTFLSYRQLVSDPRACIDRLMKQADMFGVWRNFKPNVHLTGLERLVEQRISEETLLKCQQVYQQLCSAEWRLQNEIEAVVAKQRMNWL